MNKIMLRQQRCLRVKNCCLSRNVLSKQNKFLEESYLCEKIYTLWLLGDWISLAKFGSKDLKCHTQRAKLALLLADAHLQTNNFIEAQGLIFLAKSWCADIKITQQVLISSVYNTLGRASLAKGNKDEALEYFKEAINIVFPSADKFLVSENRAVQQAIQLGLLPQAAEIIENKIDCIKGNHKQSRANIEVLESEIKLLHHELTLAQQKQQLFLVQKEHATVATANDFKKELQSKSFSQLGQDIWVLEKTNFKRGGFFVEFGATNGVLLSNSWLLEKEFGWTGICAEPNPKFFEELKHNRNCIVSNQYIGKESGQDIKFVLAGVYGGSIEFAASDKHEKTRQAYIDSGCVTTFKTISLNDFLKQHGAPNNIDYISIDTEGSEYEILSSFLFKKWNVRLFTIEHNETEVREQIFCLMKENGYRRTKCQWDDWYELDVC